MTNNKYEGEITGKGSKVIIPLRPTVITGDYQVNGKIAYQDLTDDKVELPIDKAKYWAVKIDDIDTVQSHIALWDQVTTDAAQALQIAADTVVLGQMVADAGQAIASQQVTKANVLDWIIEAGVKLDEFNFPQDGRYLVIPPWVGGKIAGSDLKDASLSGDSMSILRNGRLGRIWNFTLYVSNLLPVVAGATQAFAGHKSATTYASQIVKTQKLTLQDTFAEAVRGLHVFGFKTVLDDGLVAMPATK